MARFEDSLSQARQSLSDASEDAIRRLAQHWAHGGSAAPANAAKRTVLEAIDRLGRLQAAQLRAAADGTDPEAPQEAESDASARESSPALAPAQANAPASAEVPPSESPPSSPPAGDAAHTAPDSTKSQ
jgi:hypothetical protein